MEIIISSFISLKFLVVCDKSIDFWMAVLRGGDRIEDFWMLGLEIELEFQLVLVPLCLFGGKFEFKELKAMLSSQGAHILISII